MAVTRVDAKDRWLIALDIDGTLLFEDGTVDPDVAAEIVRLREAGHEVMLATGRAVEHTLPVARQLGINSEYVVCSNGAITLKRDPLGEGGYRREFVETFNPGPVLKRIRPYLLNAYYGVETPDGRLWYTEEFPSEAMGMNAKKATFEELLNLNATRVVVISPKHSTEDFLTAVEKMGLHKVSYSIGWTAWLDIAPDGVNKATALEQVRSLLGIPRSRVFAIGDGRNDIDMLTWAGEHGRGVAMGQSPEEVLSIASEVTGALRESGLSTVLRTI